jgi:hypothetical protein
MSLQGFFGSERPGQFFGAGQGPLWGVALVAAATLPLHPGHLAQLEALNRELGKLCGGHPPRQALTVCRLHAKLVGAR